MTSPKPHQDELEIWIGGAGGPAQRRAARVGQGWHPMCSAEGLARRLPRFVERLAEQGRSRADVVIAPRIDIKAVPDPGAVEVWREAGADQLIVGVSSGDLTEIRAGLQQLATFL